MTKQWPPMPVPPVPAEIVQAASEANLVIFVGAGVSLLMGCPSWDQLAQACLRHLAVKGTITFGDVEQLAHLDAKMKLTIALQVAEAEGRPLELPKLVQPERDTGSRVYEHLKRVGCSYVTTNYDRFLDRDPIIPDPATPGSAAEASVAESSELICWPRQFTASRLHVPGTVIHLHGSIDQPASMIVTTPDYLHHYEDEFVRQFLDELFKRYTVLFIGYGLEEWEILEHVLRKGQQSSALQASRFMLAGYFSHQEKTYSHLRHYYQKSFGVRLLPFRRDALDHGQLEHILEDWSGALKVGSPLLADDLAFLNEVVDG